MHANFSIEVSEMCAQNDGLQDELAAAERSLRMESEARGSNAGTNEPAPQPKVAFSHPFEIPGSLRYLFSSQKERSTAPSGFEGMSLNVTSSGMWFIPAITDSKL